MALAYADRASGARTSSGVSSAIPFALAESSSVALLVDVSAVSGVGPTLDLSVEWSHDGTRWAAAEPADAFAQITAAQTVVKRFDVRAPQCRIRWTIAGTAPSFTFSVDQFVGVAV